MNLQAILALIGELYAQIQKLTAENAALKQQLENAVKP